METPKRDKPLPVLLITLHNLMVADDNTYYVIKHREVKLVSHQKPQLF